MTAASPNRAATAAIRGYAYQFDLTTLEILAAGDADEVTVEGCEDVDIASGADHEAVQCKYHEDAKYTPASLRKPLALMLDAFAKGQHWDYRLYVHYKDSTSLPTSLTVAELKAVLTEKRQKPPQTIKYYSGITDVVLADFLSHLRIEPGEKYADQQAAVHAALVAALKGTADDVRDLHYANSVATVMELAMRSKPSERVITRPDFLARLNKRPAMYTRWHEEYVGRDRFQKALKRRLSAVGLLAADRRRLIILESSHSPADDGLIDVAHLIEKLATSMYGAGKLANARPWTVALNGSEEELTAIKTKLLSAGIIFNDGFEHIQFSPTIFDRDPIINLVGSGKAIKITSYDVRLVSAANYRAHKAEIRAPSTVVSFSSTPASDYTPNESTRTLDIPGWRPEDILTLLEGAK